MCASDLTHRAPVKLLLLLVLELQGRIVGDVVEHNHQGGVALLGDEVIASLHGCLLRIARHGHAVGVELLGTHRHYT